MPRRLLQLSRKRCTRSHSKSLPTSWRRKRFWPQAGVVVLLAVWDEPPRVGVREIDRRGKGVPHDAGQGKNQGAAAQTGQEARDQGPVEDEQGRAQSSRRPSQLAARSTFQAKAITRGLVQNGPSASFCLLPSAFRRRTEFRLSALRTVEEELGRLIEIVAVVRAPGLLVRRQPHGRAFDTRRAAGQRLALTNVCLGRCKERRRWFTRAPAGSRIRVEYRWAADPR